MKLLHGGTLYLLIFLCETLEIKTTHQHIFFFLMFQILLVLFELENHSDRADICQEAANFSDAAGVST